MFELGFNLGQVCKEGVAFGGDLQTFGGVAFFHAGRDEAEVRFNLGQVGGRFLISLPEG